MQWFRLYDDLLDDYEIQRLTPTKFTEALRNATSASPSPDNPFLDFIAGPFGRKDDRPPIAEWRIIRERIFKRDDYTCGYCGERGGRLECDHVVPVSRGGTHDDDNLLTACFSCNRSKHSKLIEEWR